jgi:hypothetical protein
MPQHEISFSLQVKNELEARQMKDALQSIATTFKPHELALIAKKVQLPLVQLKIRSMI